MTLIKRSSDFSHNYFGGRMVTVYNNFGQVVYSVSSSGPALKLNTQSRSNGIYLVSIMEGENILVRRFVVDHLR